MQNLLRQQNVYPVLVDVGAAGDAPVLWLPIARQSIYVGFDPDPREMKDRPLHPWHREHIVPAAVTHDPTQQKIKFFLTQAPQCSSTLEPDSASLSDYLFAELFTVEGQTQASATTLSDALTTLHISYPDWLKLDTQGTDLRLFQSLPPDLRAHVLAVDVEPGLIDAYQGEDLFMETHSALLNEGFWLSRADVRGTVRVGAETRAALPQLGLSMNTLSRGVRASPGWIEARYLRTIKGLQGMSLREYVLLWTFAMLDMQPAFALDVAQACRDVKGGTEVALQMELEAVRAVRKGEHRERLARTAALPGRALRRAARLWRKS